MTDFFPLISPLLYKLKPETAHHAAIAALKCGFLPKQPLHQHPTTIGKVDVVNPIGMAAGFDKNGEALSGLFDQGFGFVECGTVTPRPQVGNPKPRLFRLTEDHAIINRMGFNNAGLDALKRNLEKQDASITYARMQGQKLGINIGKNKETENATDDYRIMLRGVADLADYVTINISSPNTPGLRNLQSEDALAELLGALLSEREKLSKNVPLWLKLAPDIDDGTMDEIARVLESHPMDAVIISNTTISRPRTLQSSFKEEAGGLSGAPLLKLANETLEEMRQRLPATMPIIGVGGIASGEDAIKKMKAGANAVQIYSALIFQGFALVPEIAEALLKKDAS